MNPKLTALLIAAFTIGSGVVYFVPKATTTRNEMVDAGVAVDCNFRDVACTFYDSSTGYEEKTFIIGLCGGGQRIVPRWVALQYLKGVDLDSNCRLGGVATLAQMDPDAVEVKQAGSCACCDPVKGQCRYADGGVQRGNNMATPGQWRAADTGWQARPCGQLFGIPNTVTGCVR